MKPNKAATFESLLELMENAEYAYSEENRDNNESASVPMFHYFLADAIIGNKHIPVIIQVRDIVLRCWCLPRRSTITVSAGS